MLTRSRLRAATALLAVALLGCGGDDVGDPAVPASVGEVDPSLYEFDIQRCEIESAADTEAALGEPLFGDERRPRVVAEFEITNRDDVRRRFEVRATRTDANGTSVRFTAHQTERLDPGESSTEIIRTSVGGDEEPPFTCTAEVWDSLLDAEFPDD